LFFKNRHISSALAELIRSTRAPTKDRLIGKIMGGNPAFRGTREPVHMLAELVPSRVRAHALPEGKCDLDVAELQRRCCFGQQRPQALLAFADRPLANRFAVEMEKVEQEKGKRVAVPRVRCILDQAERGRAVRPTARAWQGSWNSPGRLPSCIPPPSC
jgi:hypothetical protein